MATRCRNCVILEKSKYWNELPQTEHRFFKVMNCDFKHRLWLPKKFVECLNDKLSGFCTLNGPSGNQWRVGLSRAEENGHASLVFSDGWDKFIADHDVKLYDFLTFQFTGNSSFKVLIFDRTGCEREDAYFIKKGSTSCKACKSILHVEGNVGSSENISVSEDLGEGLPPQSEGEKENPISVAGGGSSSDAFEEENELLSELPSCSSSRRNITRAKHLQRIHISNRRLLTQKEKKNVLKKARAHKHKSGVPTIDIIMKKTHVYQGFNMTIPKQWAIKYMLKESHDIELRIPSSGRSWTVGCRWTTKSMQCQLRANWSRFVFDNNLEQHDICVFELIKKGKSGGTRNEIPVFDVYIYRALNTISPLTISKRLV